MKSKLAKPELKLAKSGKTYLIVKDQTKEATTGQLAAYQLLLNSNWYDN